MIQLFLNYNVHMGKKSDSDLEYPPSFSAILNALSDPTRRQIVYRLSERPGLCNSFGDLGSKTKLSYHFAELRHAGLTRTEKQGTWRVMHLRLDEVEKLYPGLLSAILKGAAEEQPARDDGDVPAGFVEEDESLCTYSEPPKHRNRKVN
jgi:DNA-binding transcriptional ArsR family regulator